MAGITGTGAFDDLTQYVPATRRQPCAAEEHSRVIGDYAISTAIEQRIALPNAKLRRAMPERVPLLLIGRLAIDASYQGQGIGTALLSDALRRCCAASDIVGARGVVAHAIDDDAVHFYRRHGFLSSPLGERVVVMPIETSRVLFAASVHPTPRRTASRPQNGGPRTD